MATSAWFLSDLGGTAVQVLAYWLIQIVLDVGYIVLSVRVTRLPDLPGASRRFWRVIVFGGVMNLAGDLVQVAYALRDPGPSSLVSTAIQMAFIAIGIACLVWVMLTHPMRVYGRERLRLWLDAATIMTAVVVIAWDFSLSGQVDTGGTGELIAALIGSGLMLVAAFGVVKLLLGHAAPFTTLAGVMGATGVAAIGVSAGLAGALYASGHLGPVLAVRLLPCFLLVATPRVQELQVRSDPTVLGPRARRPYSRLPYLAVAATHVMLVSVLGGLQLTTRAWGVLAGVVAITCLVVVRQLIGFSDNAKLLKTLDQKMLQLRQQEERFRSLVQHASDITVVLRLDGTIGYASPALDRVLGVAPEEAVGRPARELLHPDDLTDVLPLVRRLLDSPRETVNCQLRVRHADGGWRWLELVGTNRLDDPSVSGIICNARDVTDARDFQDRLRFEATHDPLTKLANRLLFDERVRGESAGPDGVEPETILAIDLDDFKRVNDTLGHHVGDGLLVTVAQRLHRCVRPTDTVARLGGDEFAVLLPHTSREEAVAITDRIIASFSEPVLVEGNRLTVRVSIGMATGRPDEAETLLRDADAAMYVVKQRGKGGYVYAQSAA
jgi:diguanylate cyclase (GGDEF)-like protein/PAS domain S-box-containing protein